MTSHPETPHGTTNREAPVGEIPEGEAPGGETPDRVIPGRRTEGGRWFRIGLACWGLLAAVYIVGMALRRASYGLPAFGSVWEVTNALLMMLAGAALTPLVLLAFRRGRSTADGRSQAALRFAVIGVAYWLAWSGLVFGFGLVGLIGPGRATLANALVFSAFIAIASYAVLVMLYEAMRYKRRARTEELRAARLQADLARERAAAVRARINPDFLFRTLDTASELMAEDPRAARRTLADLGVLLRVSLGRGGAERVLLSEELELFERYMDIRRAGSGLPIEMMKRVEPGVGASRIPPLLLQPIAEALLRDPKEEAGAGPVRLGVTAGRSGERLVLWVMGDAVGIGEVTRGLLQTADPPGMDFGGIRTRLRAIYGDEASVSWSYGAGVGGELEETGMRIEISIPQEPGWGSGAPASPEALGEGGSDAR